MGSIPLLDRLIGFDLVPPLRKTETARLRLLVLQAVDFRMLRRNIAAPQKVELVPVASSTNSWMDLPFKAMQLGVEAQAVVSLRLLKLSLGGTSAIAEAERMITEKAWAAIGVQADFLTNTLVGQHHRASSRALARYRQKVRANRRRLTNSF